MNRDPRQRSLAQYARRVRAHRRLGDVGWLAAVLVAMATALSLPHAPTMS